MIYQRSDELWIAGIASHRLSNPSLVSDLFRGAFRYWFVQVIENHLGALQAASERHISYPIPIPAPVMTATFPVNELCAILRYT